MEQIRRSAYIIEVLFTRIDDQDVPAAIPVPEHLGIPVPTAEIGQDGVVRVGMEMLAAIDRHHQALGGRAALRAAGLSARRSIIEKHRGLRAIAKPGSVFLVYESRSGKKRARFRRES